MTDADVAQLPVDYRAPVPRHVFPPGGDVYVAQDPERGRPHPQTERTCSVCSVVKITVHGPNGGAWREWRLPNCVDQFSDALGAPPCTSTGAGA